MFLLDTHVWIWALDDNTRRLGRTTRRLLMRASSAGTVRVSAVSAFEIAALHTAGNLHLSLSPEQWIRQSLESAHFRWAELTADVAIDAGYIPVSALADPADRLLVAAARQLDATFVTADRAILTYARGGHVRVHDATR